MKLIYRTIAHYPKAYKAIKIGLLVIILLLSQTFVSLFHSELILQQQLKEEGAPFTQIYAFRNSETDYPGALTWFLRYFIEYDDYGIDDVVVSRAIIMSDDLFFESNEKTMVQELAGKDVSELQDKEVAVSSAYAIQNFGSVENAIGQFMRIPLEKTQNDLEVIEVDVKIASVYAHSGLNRRFLNVLSDYEFDPTGGNSVYSEVMYVAEDRFYDFMVLVGNQYYINDDIDVYNYGDGNVRTRFVTKYTVYYEDYSLENEARLASDLQIRSSQYDSYYVIFQSLGNIINASALMSSSIGFMSSFQFVSLFVLLTSILFYLVFLQQVAIEKNEDSLWKIGVGQKMINGLKLLHELLIVVLGFFIWLGINVGLQLIFKEKMLYITEMFVFHQVIVFINIFVAVVVWIVFTLGAKLVNLHPNVSRIFDRKKNYQKLFTKNFYLKRLYAITPRRFLLMVLVGMLCTGSFYILSRFEPEINDIYVKEQPIRYDFSIKLNYLQQERFAFEPLQEFASSHLYYQEHHNNVIFTQKVVQGNTNSTKATHANLYSDDIWSFIDVPHYPDRTIEQQAMIERNSSIILSRQLQEVLGVDEDVLYDFDLLYGEIEYHPETGEGRFVDDLDLYVVPPRYFQAWGSLEGNAKVRVLGFDNIIDNNGFMYYNVNHPALEERFNIGHNERTPVTIYFNLKEDVRLSSLKKTLIDLEANDLIDSYELGMNENIFDYTGSDTRITAILLWTTFSLYGGLIVLLVIMKDLNDRLLQQKNNRIYYNLGFRDNVITKNMRQLNFMSMVSGFALGVAIVVLTMPIIRYFLYEVLVLFH